jgi:beta-keto acid cleavage enzyme
VADAKAFVQTNIANLCVRVLVEPLDAAPDTALAHAAAIEDILVEAGVSLEQVHHGDEFASWAVCRRAHTRGHGIRTGFEDTTVLPDGNPARDNATLVRASFAMITTRDELEVRSS